MRVGVALCALYVLMQTFAIPGTISLSLLAGALFGHAVGFAMTALISTVGSSCCYAMSWVIGRPLVHALWPERTEKFRKQVAARRGQLFNYLLFLRLTPVLPNTFINVASPIVGVPLPHFFAATLLGCAPNNFMAARAGDHLSELDDLSDLYDRRMLGLGVTIGAVALLPIWLKRRGAAGGVGEEEEGGGGGDGKAGGVATRSRRAR